MLFERALEHLGEAVAADPALSMWLDRTLCVLKLVHIVLALTVNQCHVLLLAGVTTRVVEMYDR